MSPILDIQAKAEATFPKLGVIRKGAKKGQNKPGQDLTHFRLDDAAEVAEAYQALYGTTEPREMGIFLPFDDLDRVFRAYHELYSAGTLLCQGDGKQVQYMRNPQTGQLLARNGYAVVDFQVGQAKFAIGESIPCPGMAHGLYPHCAKCKPHGYLMAIIPEVKRFGYYEFKTTSFYDILNLTGNLRAIMALNNGRLTGVPLVVRRAPQQISTPTPDGKRVRREKWLLSIEAAPGWVDMMQRRWNALEAGDAPLALLASGDEAADEDDENGGFIEATATETEPVDYAGDYFQDAFEEEEEDDEGDPSLMTLTEAQELFGGMKRGEKASDKRARAVAGLLNSAIGGKAADAERHALLEVSCGVTSASDLYKAQANQWIEFLTDKEAIEKRKDWSVTVYGKRLVGAWLREMRQWQGQQPLPLGDPRPGDLSEAARLAMAG